MASMVGRRLAQVHSAQRAGEVRERQTFIALRACRKAMQVARRVRFGRPVDVDHTYCQVCGAEVDCTKYDDWVGLQCTSCGEWVRVPGYVRGRVRELDPVGEEQLRHVRWAIIQKPPVAWPTWHLEDDDDPKELRWERKFATIVLLCIVFFGLALFAIWAVAG